MGGGFNFHTAEMFSFILTWLDIIGPTTRTILDLFLAIVNSALAFALIIAAVKAGE